MLNILCDIIYDVRDKRVIDRTVSETTGLNYCSEGQA